MLTNDILVRELAMQNERIANLYTIGPVQRAEVTQFVEAIVLEHINLLRQEWYDLNNLLETPEDTPRSVAIRVGKKSEVIALMHKIKQHFGITE